MDPLQQPPAPHRRGRPPPPPPPLQQPPPPRPRRQPPQPQQYPYNPTLQHDLTHYNPTNGIESLFRNASVTKVIVLFTIVYYFLQQNTNSSFSSTSSSSSWYSNTNNNNNHENETINVFKILLRPYSNSYYQYIISKMIFFLSSNNRSSSTMNHTTTLDEHSNQYSSNNNSTVILIMNVLYQFYLYRIIERQMSSYQLIRFLIYVMMGTIVVEYIFTYVLLQYTLIIPYGIQRNKNTLLDVVITSSSSFLYGPYSIIGALSLYYHWYIPRIYPRFVTILSIFHFSEKSIFYFYTIYFIIINSNHHTSTNIGNHNHDNQQVLFNVLYGYRGTINVIVSMSLGMILSILYYYLSNHPIIVKYDQWVYHRIIQPTIQRFNHTIATATTTNHRTNNNNNNIDRRNTTTNNTNHRVAQPPPPPQIPPPQLRQRYNTATTAAAAAAAGAAMDNNPWRIPHDSNNVNDDDETDQMNMFGGSNAAADATVGVGGMNDIPLLPTENVDTEAVEQLCHMGFERNNVITALRQSHNNIEHAANRLLSSTTTGTSD